jgi:hypothetical protein
MRLADEVRAEIQAFVAGRISVHELEGWLDSVAHEVHAEKDPVLRPLTDRTYSLLAEISYGDRTVNDARRELERLVNSTTSAADSTSPLAKSTIARSATD